MAIAVFRAHLNRINQVNSGRKLQGRVSGQLFGVKRCGPPFQNKPTIDADHAQVAHAICNTFENPVFQIQCVFDHIDHLHTFLWQGAAWGGEVATLGHDFVRDCNADCVPNPPKVSDDKWIRPEVLIKKPVIIDFYFLIKTSSMLYV